MKNRWQKSSPKIFIVLSISLIATASLFNSAQPKTAHAATLEVPFTTQAPLGEWNDPRQQDGCEETSIVMAWMWTQNLTLSPEEVRNYITNLSDFEQYFYGYYRDSSADDTAKLMTQYFNYYGVSVHHDATLADIKSALDNNQLVIAPINPRLISTNLYNRYTINHTVVVIGYDNMGNIIIHDPLHTNGANMPIPDTTFEKSMADYSSGQHHIVTHERSKDIIVVSKAN